MKRFLLAVLLLLGAAGAAFAQKAAEKPIHWSFEAKPAGAGQYDLVFHAKLDKGWHIFSQKPGDDFLIPPSFTYSSKVATLSDMKEVGRLKTVRMEGIDKPVNYYEGSVDFIQTVKAAKGGRIAGKLEYQICDESHCLAPTTIPFAFELK